MRIGISQYIVLVDTLQRSLTYASWPGYTDVRRQEVLDILLSDELAVVLNVSDYQSILSERQVAIVDSIASGKSREETARSLHISYSTLKREIARILDLFGAVSLEEALGRILKGYGKE